jgi:hypothetical protein
MNMAFDSSRMQYKVRAAAAMKPFSGNNDERGYRQGTVVDVGAASASAVGQH